jgi:hypothetical protein
MMFPTPPVERIYLFVPPEEYAEAGASGAAWDELSKRWYVPSGREPQTFSKWLDGEAVVSEYCIVSEAAFVACAETACLTCRTQSEIICLYCDSGADTRR